MSSQKRTKKQNRTRGRDRRRRKQGMNPLYVVIPAALVVVMVGGALLAASPEIFSSPDRSIQLPSWLQRRGPKVQRAYAQAVAHWDELRYIPCYCGCGNVGHTAVADCHIAGVAADGSIIFEEHAST